MNEDKMTKEMLELFLRINIAAGILTEGLYELNTTIKQFREKLRKEVGNKDKAKGVGYSEGNDRAM